MATNTHGSNYISSIQLPNNTIYKIHDEDAIHNIEDLGLSTPLNFRGVVDELPTGEALQTHTIDVRLEIYGGSKNTVAWSGVNEILQNPAYYPIEITYRETSADSLIVTSILKTPQATWQSESFSSLLFADTAKEQLYYDQAANVLRVVGSGTTTAKTYISSYGQTVDTISLTLTSTPHNGDVYLVKDDNDTTPDQEYVYIIPDNGGNPYWEPLGVVYDAASSTHKHTITVTGANEASTVSGTVAVPRITVTSNDIVDIIGNDPVTASVLQNAGKVTSGNAASWSATVANGVLSFSWTANTPTAVSLPSFNSVTASLITTTDREVVASVTVTPDSAPINATAAAQKWTATSDLVTSEPISNT